MPFGWGCSGRSRRLPPPDGEQSLGVVEIGPEDPALKDDHQILMADSAVRKAVKAGSRGPITPRVEHLTLRMSALGMDLWTAAYGVGE
jgi:hypothetical protein